MSNPLNMKPEDILPPKNLHLKTAAIRVIGPVGCGKTLVVKEITKALQNLGLKAESSIDNHSLQLEEDNWVLDSARNLEWKVFEDNIVFEETTLLHLQERTGMKCVCDNELVYDFLERQVRDGHLLGDDYNLVLDTLSNLETYAKRKGESYKNIRMVFENYNNEYRVYTFILKGALADRSVSVQV